MLSAHVCINCFITRLVLKLSTVPTPAKGFWFSTCPGYFPVKGICHYRICCSSRVSNVIVCFYCRHVRLEIRRALQAVLFFPRTGNLTSKPNMRKFLRAQAQNQASIKKHLMEQQANKKTAFHVDSSSSEDDDNEDREQVLQLAVSKVVSSYKGEGGDTEKSLSYLTDVFQSGGATCLICISSVKKIDPVSEKSLFRKFCYKT